MNEYDDMTRAEYEAERAHGRRWAVEIMAWLLVPILVVLAGLWGAGHIVGKW